LALPIQDPELLGLVRGLSSFHPALQQYAITSAQVDANRDMKAGAADRQMGKAIAKGSSDWYRHSYMMQDGQVKGDIDGQGLLQAYETGFDKDTGDVDGFIREHFQKQTAGITDQSFLEGYHQSLAPHIDAIRNGQLKYQQAAVVQKVEANGLYKLDSALNKVVEAGQPITVDVLEAARKDLVGNFEGTISNTRFNDLAFAAIDKLGKQGNYAAYDVLKQPKPDGTPGMYFIPGWKEKIDAAQIHSQATFMNNRKAADAEVKRQREDKQDEALYEVFSQMDTDPVAAKQKYETLRSSGLFTRASELINWDTKVAAAGKREASASQMDLEVTLQQGIYSGTVRPHDILRADITPAQKRSLMSESYRVKNDARQAAAAGQRAEDAIYRTQDFRSNEDYIQTVLRPQASPLDPMGIGTEFARQQLAAARREFTVRAREVKSPQELYGLAQEISQRFLDRAKDPRINKELNTAGSLRYSTLEELKAARLAGRITDPIEYQNQLRYFKDTQVNASR
jgi:hypothetical protein